MWLVKGFLFGLLEIYRVNLVGVEFFYINGFVGFFNVFSISFLDSSDFVIFD